MTSSLIMPEKTTAKVEVLPKHETCATCTHAQLVPQDLNVVVCYGAPPTPVLMGMQQTPLGQQPAMANIRPTMPRTERACGVWARKNALVVG